jgi:transcriptional regulator with XRE-family HTH domain
MNKNTYKSLGEFISLKATEKYGFDHKKRLAEDCGISISTIERIEKNNIHPKTKTLRKLSEVLECDYIYLLQLNDDLNEEDINKFHKGYINKFELVTELYDMPIIVSRNKVIKMLKEM